MVGGPRLELRSGHSYSRIAACGFLVTRKKLLVDVKMSRLELYRRLQRDVQKRATCLEGESWRRRSWTCARRCACAFAKPAVLSGVDCGIMVLDFLGLG